MRKYNSFFWHVCSRFHICVRTHTWMLLSEWKRHYEPFNVHTSLANTPQIDWYIISWTLLSKISESRKGYANNVLFYRRNKISLVWYSTLLIAQIWRKSIEVWGLFIACLWILPRYLSKCTVFFPKLFYFSIFIEIFNFLLKFVKIGGIRNALVRFLVRFISININY